MPLADAENVRVVSFRPTDGGPDQLTHFFPLQPEDRIIPVRHRFPRASFNRTTEPIRVRFFSLLKRRSSEILRNLKKPRAKPGRGLIAFSGAKDTQENFLGHVFRFIDITKGTKKASFQWKPPGLHEFFEGARFIALNLEHELDAGVVIEARFFERRHGTRQRSE